MRAPGFVLLLAFASHAGAADEAARWSYHPAPVFPASAGMATLDLDADGRTDLVLGTHSHGLDIDTVARATVRDGRVQLDAVVFLGANERLVGKVMAVPGPPASPGRVAALVDEEISFAQHRRFLRTWEGAALRQVAEIELDRAFFPDAIADLDADGAPEIYGRANRSEQEPASGAIEVRDYATGNLEWTSAPTRIALHLAAGQLDADPALELIVSNSDNPQQSAVLDGATHAVDWSFVDGFRGPAVVGNFDDVPSTREFAVAGYSGIVVYATSPVFSPLAEIPRGQALALRAADLDGDGVDEILAGDVGFGDLHVYDTRTRGERYAIDNPGSGVAAIATLPMDGDAALEVLFASASTNETAFIGFDGVSRALFLRQFGERGPHAPLRADLDGDGHAEIALATQPDAYRASPLLTVLQPGTGVLRQSTAFMAGVGSERLLLLGAANIDGDPAAELWVTDGRPPWLSPASSYAVIDAATGAQQAFVSIADGPALASLLAPLTGDDVPDLALAADGRVLLFDSLTHQEAWRSVPFGGNDAQALASGQADADPATELVYATGTNIHVIDMTLKLVQASFAHAGAPLAIAIEGTPGACSLAIFEATRIVRRDCGSGAETSQRSLPWTVTFVRAFPDSHGRLVVADGARAGVVEGDVVVAQSRHLDSALGAGNRGAASSEGDHAVAWLGGWTGAHRIDLFPRRVHANGFE